MEKDLYLNHLLQLQRSILLISYCYLSAITNISKSSVVNLSSLENAPSFAPKISIFVNPSVFNIHVISDGM